MPYHNSCGQCGTYKSKSHLRVGQYCGGAVTSWGAQTIRAKRIIGKDGMVELVSINDVKDGFIVDLEVVE